MAFDNHRFCWHGIISSDTATTTPFYSTVLGWSVQTAPMGDEIATMFAASDGRPRAHTRAPAMEGEPNYWSSYFRVEDVDGDAAKAVANGGKLLVPPTDIAPGRFATVMSPSGAAFNLFHEAGGDDSNAGDADGAIHWVELHSTDIDGDLAWLNATFGVTSQTMQMPDGPYHLLFSGETQVGGAVTQKNPGAPSMWLPWIRQDDVDGTVARVEQNGGKTLVPLFDVEGIGRMSIIADPVGGVVGVIRPPAKS